MVRGLPIAFEVIPTQTFQLDHGLCRTGVQGAGNGGLLSACFTSKGALHGRIHPHRDIALGDGFGPTQHTHQRIEQFVYRLMLDGLLRDLYLLAQRGKELQPTQILAQCTKTGPPTLQLARFGHGALLLRSGNASWPRPFPSAIRFIGVRFARFSAVLKVLLPCAKNWQLRLDPLNRETTDELLTDLLSDESNLEPLRRLIAERTEGNPFFIEEMVQALFEQGAIARNGTVKLMRPLTEVKVPATVQAVLASRIDRLPADKKDL